MRTFWKLSEDFFRTFCGISKAFLQIYFLFISVSKKFCQFLPVSPPLFLVFCIFSAFFPLCMFLSFSSHFFRLFLFLPVFPSFTGLALFLLISSFFPVSSVFPLLVSSHFFILPVSCFLPVLLVSSHFFPLLIFPVFSWFSFVNLVSSFF